MNLPRITDFLNNADPDCPVCEGAGLVCEDHPDQSWPDGGDQCPVGMPCPCTGVQ